MLELLIYRHFCKHLFKVSSFLMLKVILNVVKFDRAQKLFQSFLNANRKKHCETSVITKVKTEIKLNHFISVITI